MIPIVGDDGCSISGWIIRTAALMGRWIWRARSTGA